MYGGTNKRTNKAKRRWISDAIYVYNRDWIWYVIIIYFIVGITLSTPVCIYIFLVSLYALLRWFFSFFFFCFISSVCFFQPVFVSSYCACCTRIVSMGTSALLKACFKSQPHYCLWMIEREKKSWINTCRNQKGIIYKQQLKTGLTTIRVCNENWLRRSQSKSESVYVYIAQCAMCP